MEIFYGRVRTLERFFSYGPDGTLRFEPFNIAYGTVHPASGPGTDKDDVELVLNDGEFFQVWDHIRSYPAGNFLDYRAAYAKARTCGDHGIARIVIVTPDGFQNVTAQAADGTAVIMGRDTQWQTASLPSRVRFLNRPATDPAVGSKDA
ncbi:MAG TPA: hypothetical protein VF885_08285 [Arthrobacter sp.]